MGTQRLHAHLAWHGIVAKSFESNPAVSGSQAVIPVALIDDLAVLDPHEGHSVEAERLAVAGVSGPQAPVLVPAKVSSNATPFALSIGSPVIFQ